MRIIASIIQILLLYVPVCLIIHGFQHPLDQMEYDVIYGCSAIIAVIQSWKGNKIIPAILWCLFAIALIWNHRAFFSTIYKSEPLVSASQVAPQIAQSAVLEYPAILKSIKPHYNEYGEPVYKFMAEDGKIYDVQGALSYGSTGNLLINTPPTPDQVNVKGIWVIFPYDNLSVWWAAYHVNSKQD